MNELICECMVLVKYVNAFVIQICREREWGKTIAEQLWRTFILFTVHWFRLIAGSNPGFMIFLVFSLLRPYTHTNTLMIAGETISLCSLVIGIQGIIFSR